MGESRTVGIWADEELRDGINEYGSRRGMKESEAARELVRVGLREQRHPWVWRFKDRVIEWVNLLSISAVLVFTLGVTTDIVSWVDGIIASFFMLALAVVLLSGFEAARMLAGANEHGVWLRGVVTAVVSGRE